ncbi:7487_t:CDS:1 [Funneliformis caledonium]|uniref:7487_t:CDS:1 n=1 Tax=Funneliformis caledonium TaxID=1117310 RepID=A0A9N9FZN8_9GLOM|nr:7487_t:CDS:1 [Funneliformis caledonium]
MSTPLNIDNVSNWTSNDFEELKKIIHDLIPHIRWFQIPSKTFWRNVDPYESIFPRNLYKDIIGYHFDPDTPPDTLVLPQRNDLSFNSVLINKNHFLILASLIDKKDKFFYGSRNIPYSFKLLFRASRDGFEVKTFHELCGNKGPTIMISKLQENGKLIGGYNPLSWKPFESEGHWGSTSDSFLFSFAKMDDLDSIYISRVKDQRYAVYYPSASNIGPAFGGGCDLFIQGNNINRNNFIANTYPEANKILDLSVKSIVDYEIFQVIQK